MDLCKQKSLMDYYKKIGYIVLSNTKEDIVKLKKLISRKYVAISGQSGAGKSTLINTLTTNLYIETGDKERIEVPENASRPPGPPRIGLFGGAFDPPHYAPTQIGRASCRERV